MSGRGHAMRRAVGWWRGRQTEKVKLLFPAHRRRMAGSAESVVKSTIPSPSFPTLSLPFSLSLNKVSGDNMPANVR